VVPRGRRLESSVFVEAEESAGTTILDLDAEGRLIGIEVLVGKASPTSLLDEAERL
jgi:uncharacterized protein YuzE